MAKSEFSVPEEIKENCLICSKNSNVEGIRMNVYKWAGTDRITIQWQQFGKTRFKSMGKMELHYTELYNSVGELLNDLDYLTNVMVENGFGVLDLRDMNVNREFDADFY